MAYVGLVLDEHLVRDNVNENITGNWNLSGNNTYTGVNTFTQIIQGTALKAKYANTPNADLAEFYELYIDNGVENDYNLSKCSGYLVEVSTNKGEVIKTRKNSKNCFGIISTKPGITMNTKCEDKKHYVPVALLGRVPCQVVGKLKKGDKLTTSKYSGIAKKRTWLDALLGKPIVGIALENKSYNRQYEIEVFI